MQLDDRSLKENWKKDEVQHPYETSYHFSFAYYFQESESLWWHIKIASSRTLNAPSTAAQVPAEPAVQLTSHQATEDTYGQGATALQKT